MRKDIDFSRTVSIDDVEVIEDNIKGTMVLLDGLSFSDESGTHLYQKEAYKTLNIALEKTIKDIAIMKENIDYMQDRIRE